MVIAESVRVDVKARRSFSESEKLRIVAVYRAAPQNEKGEVPAAATAAAVTQREDLGVAAVAAGQQQTDASQQRAKDEWHRRVSGTLRHRPIRHLTLNSHEPRSRSPDCSIAEAPGYIPVKFGFRFSMNARRASVAS